MPIRFSPIPDLTQYEIALFWANVPSKPEGKCWLWFGRRHTEGYGYFFLKKKSYIASRVAYTITYGEPGDLLVCHDCDNKQCVNPDHLMIGTYSDNQKQAFARGLNSNKGILNPRRKLWPCDVEMILKSDKTYEQLAAELNVSDSTIHAIKSRRIQCLRNPAFGPRP